MSYKTKYLQIVDCLPERDKRLLACRIARWVLTEHQVEDTRLWEAVEVSERYAEGLATLEELRAARIAADDAAAAAARDTREAAREAAWAAAEAAAWAARAAAWAAREAAAAAALAAREAAEAAAGDAAEDATYKMFFEWAMELAIGEKVAA